MLNLSKTYKGGHFYLPFVLKDKEWHNEY